MSVKNYTDIDTLRSFLDNLKATFAPKSHKHTISELTDYVVDTELSSTSTNPVQNKAVTAAINDLSYIDINLEGSTSASPNPVNADTLGGHTIDSLVDLVAATIPETDVVITTDSKLDSTSENPVQNKVITE